MALLLDEAPIDLSQPPVRLPGFAVDLPDYPRDAWRKNWEGRVTIMLDVGMDGAPTRCTPIERSEHPSLDEGACTVALARMRFSSALDRSGNPVAGQANAMICWKLRR